MQEIDENYNRNFIRRFRDSLAECTEGLLELSNSNSPDKFDQGVRLNKDGNFYRHEYFNAIMCHRNGLVHKPEEKLYKAFTREFFNSPIYNDIRGRGVFQKHDAFGKKTPDRVIFRGGGDEKSVALIDFAVSRDFRMAVNNKTEKYMKIVESIQDICHSQLDLYVVDLNNRTVRVWSSSERHLLTNQPSDAELDVIYNFDEAQRRFEESLSSDLKDALRSLMNIQDENMEHIMKDFDFAIDKKSYMEFMESHAETLDMCESRVGKGFLKDIEVLIERRSLNSTSEDLEKGLPSHLVFDETPEHHDCPLPSIPSKETIKDSFKVLESKAQEKFKVLRKPKPLSPFPVSELRQHFTDETSDANFKTLREFSKAFSNKSFVMDADVDAIGTELAKLFRFNNMTEKDFETMNATDGSFFTPEGEFIYKENSNPDEEKRLEFPKGWRGLPVIQQIQDEMFEDKNNLIPKGSLSFKGSSLNIKNMKSELKSVFAHMKIGLKEEDRDFRTGDEKVESLEFWNDSASTQLLGEFNEDLDSIVSVLRRRGRDLMELKFSAEKNKSKPTKRQKRLTLMQLAEKNLISESECEMVEKFTERMSRKIASGASSGWDVIQGLFGKGFRAKDTNLVLDIESEISRYLKLDMGGLPRIKSLFEELIVGCLSFCREVEVLSESLIFNSRNGNKGIKVCFGTNANNMLIMFPTGSILNGNVQVPYMSVTLLKDAHESDLRGRIFSDPLHNFVVPCKRDLLVISMGRRLDMSRLTKYTSLRSHFLATLSCLAMIREREEGGLQISVNSIALGLMVNLNVNICTSSLLDNIHWIVDDTIADFSFAREYIEDKFSVACRNTFQVWIYKRTKHLLEVLNDRIRVSNVEQGMYDEETDTVDLSRIKLTGATYPSILEPFRDFKDVFSLISECQVLYFACPKALHQKTHNAVEIHKLPIDIQKDIDEKLEVMNGLGECLAVSTPKGRYNFSPAYMVKLAEVIEDNLQASIGSIRSNMVKSEKFNSHPFTIPTMVSTRSVLVETGRDLTGDQINGDVLDEKGNLVISDKVKIPRERLIKLQRSVNSASKPKKKTTLRNFKHELAHMVIEVTRNCSRNDKNAILAELEKKLSSLKVSRMTGKFMIMGHGNLEEKSKVRVSYVQGTKDYQSSVVITETIRHVNGKTETESHNCSLGREAKWFVLGDKLFVFGCRPKGQRTQKDREIYVLNLPFKTSMYVAEHVYKGVSKYLQTECISIPGDLKTIKMQEQVSSILAQKVRWEKAGKKVHLFNFNLDMTKWAPKDIMLKYAYFYARARFLTKDEKRYLICLIIKSMEKKMHVQHGLIESMEKSRKTGKVFGEDRSLFHSLYLGGASESYTNTVDIVDTWLMGQWNYPSSVVHAACMKMVQKNIEEVYGKENVFAQLNVHSDDNQCSFLVCSEDSPSKVVENIWKILDFNTRLGCMELSRKKSTISSVMKQFVSQYNIGGEQKTLDVKLLMSCVSGLPWLSTVDDYSSIVSKVSTAMAAGAIPEYVMPLLKELFNHVGGVYGLVKKGKNIVSNKLDVPEQFLPLCLGGGFTTDPTLMSIAGPKSCDKDTLYRLLTTGCGATHSLPPSRLPVNPKIKNALKLFLVCDLLSQEAIIDIDEQLTDCANPFRPIRFQIKRSQTKDPYFGFFTESELKVIIENFKRENPSCMIRKPKDFLGLSKFFLMLYQNPSFRAALASQSPSALKMSKIINRNSGNFRFMNETTVQVYKLEQANENTGKMAYNAEEVSDIFKMAMDSIEEQLNLPNLNLLWVKYIDSDPEVKAYYSCIGTSEITTTFMRPNLVAVRKPDFQEFCKLVNPVSDILCYLFDGDNFKSSGGSIRFKNSLTEDFRVLCNAYPALFTVLTELRKEDPDRYRNFDLLMSNLTTRAKSILYEHSLADYASNYITKGMLISVLKGHNAVLNTSTNEETNKMELRSMDRKFLEIEKQIESNTNRLRYHSGKRHMENKIMSEINNLRAERNNLILRKNILTAEIGRISMEKEEFIARLREIGLDKEVLTPVQMTISHTKDSWVSNYISHLPNRLADICRRLSLANKRVFFVANPPVRNAYDLILSLKSTQSCNNGVCSEWSSTMMHRSVLKVARPIAGLKGVNGIKSACEKFHNLYNLLLKLNVEVNEIGLILRNTDFGGIDMRKILLNFDCLEKWEKMRIMIPVFVSEGESVVKELVPEVHGIAIGWVRPEEGPDSLFHAIVHGSTMALSAKGKRKKLLDIKVLYQRELNMVELKMNLLKFCTDLKGGSRQMAKTVLSDHLNLIPAVPSSDLYYDQRLDVFTKYYSKNHFIVAGLSVTQKDELNPITISSVELNSLGTLLKTRVENYGYIIEFPLRRGIRGVNMNDFNMEPRVLEKLNKFINPWSFEKIIETGMWQPLTGCERTSTTLRGISSCTIRAGPMSQAFTDYSAHFFMFALGLLDPSASSQERIEPLLKILEDEKRDEIDKGGHFGTMALNNLKMSDKKEEVDPYEEKKVEERTTTFSRKDLENVKYKFKMGVHKKGHRAPSKELPWGSSYKEILRSSTEERVMKEELAAIQLGAKFSLGVIGMLRSKGLRHTLPWSKGTDKMISKGEMELMAMHVLPGVIIEACKPNGMSIMDLRDIFDQYKKLKEGFPFRNTGIMTSLSYMVEHYSRQLLQTENEEAGDITNRILGLTFGPKIQKKVHSVEEQIEKAIRANKKSQKEECFMSIRSQFDLIRESDFGFTSSSEASGVESTSAMSYSSILRREQSPRPLSVDSSSLAESTSWSLYDDDKVASFSLSSFSRANSSSTASPTKGVERAVETITEDSTVEEGVNDESEIEIEICDNEDWKDDSADSEEDYSQDPPDYDFL